MMDPLNHLLRRCGTDMLQQTKDRYWWLLRSMKLALWTGLITVLGSQTGFADKALKLDYVGYYGGLEAVRVDVSITLAEGRYAVTSATRSTGFLDYLSSFHSAVHGRGAWPLGSDQRFSLKSAYSGKQRRIELQRLPQGNFEVAITPPIPADERDPVPPSLQQDSRDPIATFMQLAMQPTATALCSGMMPIFNGKIRSDVQFRHLGSEDLQASSYSRFQGRAEKCQMTYAVRAGGYKKSWFGKDQAAPVIEVWFARRDDLAMWLPVRVRTETALATIFLHLTSPTFDAKS